MLYIIPNYYEPNTASTNRMLALLGELDNILSGKKNKAKVVFFLTDKNRNTIDAKYDNVECVYYWKKWYYLNKKPFNYLFYTICVFFFLSKLKKDDKVLMLGSVEILRWILKKKNIEVYYEITEHPDIYRFGNRLHWVDKEELLHLAKQLSGLFVISTALKRFFVSNGVDEAKIHLYNMIVDYHRFENLKKTECEDYIAYCGTASNSKDGVDLLIKTFARVHEEKPKIKLYIIGKTPSNSEANDNIKLLDTLNIKDSVVFTGIVEAEKMPQLLKNACILVLARPDSLQAQNGFPTKLGEYLLTGNPVAVTDVGDISLYLKHKESALISEPSNVEQMSKNILWALDNPTMAFKIGEKGKEVALKFFNPDIEAKKILGIIYKDNCFGE